MKLNYNKNLIISRQESILQFPLPTVFYAYNNVTSYEFKEYAENKNFLFFNSNFLTSRFDLLPLSQGSFFTEGLNDPFSLSLTTGKLTSMCITMGGYVVPYEHFVRYLHVQLLPVRHTALVRLLGVTVFPALFAFIKLYHLFFTILLSYAYYKSIVKKVS